MRRVTYIQQLTPAPGLHLHGSGDKKRRSPASRPYELGAFTGAMHLTDLTDDRISYGFKLSRVFEGPGSFFAPGYLRVDS